MTTTTSLLVADAAGGQQDIGPTIVNWLLIGLVLCWLARRIRRAVRAAQAVEDARQGRYAQIIDEYDLSAMQVGAPPYTVPREWRQTDRDIAWRLADTPRPPAVRPRRGSVAGALVAGALVASVISQQRRN